jgi:drug/metabolite transporter (DMT)-like permease
VSAETNDRQRRLAWSAWIAVCVIWGTTYFAIRVALESMPPFLMAGLRWMIAGTLLAAYLTARGERLPPLRSWGGIFLLGFLLLGLGNGGVVWAEQFVTSGLAAVIVASGPFWTTSVESMMPAGERLTLKGVLGLAIGFLGILLLVWPELTAPRSGGHGFLFGVISLQIACCGWAFGSSYSRRHARAENVFSTTAAQMLAGGVLMLLVGTLHGEWRVLTFTVRTSAALGYLATVGAIGGFVAYTYALRHLPISIVAAYAYVNPIIAVALGVAFLGEPFTGRMALAAVLVFAGVGVLQFGRQTVRPLINRTRNSTIAMTSRT